MLNIQNWPGLIQKINSSGYQVCQVDNTLKGIRISDGEVSEQINSEINAIVNSYTVNEAATYVCQQIEKMATAKRNIVVSSYSPGEMSSWPIKRLEAIAYSSSLSVADAPYLAGEASIRGITLEALVNKVLSDAAKFSGAEAAIAGNSGKHRDTVKSFTTFEQVMNYDYSTGWPV